MLKTEFESENTSRLIRIEGFDNQLEIKDVRPDAGVYSVDINSLLESMQSDWDQEIISVASQAKEVVLEPGRVRTSLAGFGEATQYHPTNGLGVEKNLPWLKDLYLNQIRQIVEYVANEPVHAGVDLEHCLNINYTKKGPYEPHVDRNPWTALLYVEDREEDQGGETILWKNSTLGKPTSDELTLDLEDLYANQLDHWGELQLKEKTTILRETGVFPLRRIEQNIEVRVRPEKGKLVIFRGSQLPHEVTSTQGKDRATVPSDYYTESNPEEIDPNFNRAIGVGSDS
jgi:hypothetical protein